MGAGKKRGKSQSDDVASPDSDWWQTLIATLGRDVIFVDTGAILEAHAPDGDPNFSKYFERTTDKFVTSEFVVAETVRRLVKAGHYQFCGPSGEQSSELAVYFVRTWLAEHRVEVLNIPKGVFSQAVKTFEHKAHVQCDLNDVISYVIVNGLEQNRIVAKDRHFRTLGLTLYPGDLP